MYKYILKEVFEAQNQAFFLINQINSSLIIVEIKKSLT